MTSAQRMHGQDRASFGAQWPQCGAQTVSAALPQKTHGETPVLCNNDLPQSNHDFCTKAAWPRPSQFWSIVTTMRGTNCECSIAAKNTWLDPCFVCNNDLPQSNHDFCTKAAWPRPSQFWSIVTTTRGTNCECSIAAKNTWLDPSFVCNNDLPQSNHDLCTKAAWPRLSQLWSIVATMWGTNSECSIAAKITW